MLGLLILFLILYGFSFLGFSVRYRLLRSKRKQVSIAIVTLFFIAGITAFFGGITFALAYPEQPQIWEPRSVALVSDENLIVPAGWKTKSEVITELASF